MAPDPTSLDPLDPGSMTVPPLFGWEHIVAVLALMAVIGAAFLLHSVARGASQGRSDWQSWLDARSSRAPSPEAAQDRAAQEIHPSRLAFRGPDESDLPRRA